MIDTAAIRAHWGLPKDTASQNVQMIDILCDAVDELRSQLDRRAERWEHDYWRVMARAAAAEADRDAERDMAARWMARTDAAEDNLAEQERVTRLLEGALKSTEARIAAALEYCGRALWVPTGGVRRALTGDTL